MAIQYICDSCGTVVEKRAQAMDVFGTSVSERIYARVVVELHVDGRAKEPDLCETCRTSIFDKLGAPYLAPVEATK